ncbi:hypothetical protein C3920_03945 [Novacetimonas pomaceti]|uniref:Uncharacterized protein n=2 Tax=Novacetimonas pomaceti TaxID=2021998 RepID=A0ABX5P453_9PROT|nr:hypothetical protein C3920_03945 [Novacetimonas pomaceti]
MMVRVLYCWILLMMLLAGELTMARLGFSSAVCACAVLMGLVIIFGFMRIAQAPPLAAIFALGGLFWLVILLSLGSLDSFTRTNFAVGSAMSSRPDHAPALPDESR